MQAMDISVEKSEQNNPAAPQRDANSKLKNISFTNVSGFNIQHLIVRTRFSGVAEASFLKN